MNNNKGHEHRDIVQRYCPNLDDNVVVIKTMDKKPDEYECMSAHLCVKKPTAGCKHAPENHNTIT
jgi:hypothetical protein